MPHFDLSFRLSRIAFLLSSAQPQSQLPGWAGVVLDEVPDAFGDRFASDVAAFLNLFGDLSRDIVGPIGKSQCDILPTITN